MSVKRRDVRTEPQVHEFEHSVLAGMSASHKSIPCRFLYDARGSELFEQITQLSEYYPTRTEVELLEAYGNEIAEIAGSGNAVVEFGSGSSRKTHILLNHLDTPAAYIPIDIDDDALREASVRIKNEFPGLDVFPVHADFNGGLQLPEALNGAPKLGFFPGSTIGNMEHDKAIEFMANAGTLLGEGSGFLVGVDLKKDLDVLLPAYDDGEGVTSAFILNLLHRINRELAGDLDVSQFKHETVYNQQHGRIEIYIVSLRAQTVEIAGRKFTLHEGERIHVENSHKYTVSQFQEMARKAQWSPVRVWTDPQQYFSVHYLRRAAAG